MKDLGIFVNRRASPEGLKKAAKIQSVIPGIVTQDVLGQQEGLAEMYKRVIIVGGDGSVRTGLNYLMGQDQFPLVGIIPGGTLNVLSRVLVENGLGTTIEEFINIDPLKLPESEQFKPGLVAGRVFTNKASVNQYDRFKIVINERLRGVLSGRTRIKVSHIGGLLLSALTIDNQKPLLNAVLTTPYYGEVAVNPEQSLNGDNLTRMSIEGDSTLLMFYKLAACLVYFNRQTLPPPSLLKVEFGKEFMMRPVHNGMDLDGDGFPMTKTEVLARRSDRGFHLRVL